MDPVVFVDNVKVKLVNHIVSVRKKYYLAKIIWK